tara:strand:+ start:7399 stop:7629 length:231 start_codon:yes stop_codon:yes gene_type:complete
VKVFKLQFVIRVRIQTKSYKKKAIWNGEVIAESDETVNIEGNHYFPPSAIKQSFFEENETHTVCPWKGSASFYDSI